MTFQLYYYRSAEGNFGDDLNGWIWEDLAPGAWDPASPILFSGIGTIIGNRMPPNEHTVIFSSGVGYSPPPSLDPARYTVGSVRGPLSARVLGLAESDAITDGAILLLATSHFRSNQPVERSGVIFIPHHEAMREPMIGKAAEAAGIAVVDPRQDSLAVIDRIRRAELVIADSMHAAIIADTFGTPWVPVTTSSGINAFKWVDWTRSVGLPYEPVSLPPASLQWALQDRAQGLVGEAFRGAACDEESAMRQYRQVMRFRSDVAWEQKRDGRKRIIKRVLGLQKRAIARPAVKAIDSRLFARCVRAFDQVKRGNGFLSEPARREELLARMQERFRQVMRSHGGHDA